MQVRFTNPKDGTFYDWPINPPYEGPQQSQKQRNIDRQSNTANVGATKQQGDDGPYIIHWEVEVFHTAHEAAMWHWYQLCKTQTIYLRDWNANSFEGQITSLSDQWVGVIAGPGDATLRGGYVKFDFSFEVWRFISGLMATAGVKP